MKKTLLTLAFVLTASMPVAFAASAQTAPLTEYQKAVKSYVDAATTDLGAVRSGIEAEAKDATSAVKPREGVTGALERCEKLLADLKKAGPADFDRVKAEYEKARSALGKQLETARRS